MEVVLGKTSGPLTELPLIHLFYSSVLRIQLIQEKAAAQYTVQ